MGRRWQWAPGLESRLCDLLTRTFDPDALAPASLPNHRRTAGRAYGLLPPRPDLPFDVFIKEFLYCSRWARARDLCRRSGAIKEFDAAVRLHGLGLPVPRPLALMSEPDPGTGRRCFLLMEHLGPGTILSKALAVAPAGGHSRVRELAAQTARLLVDVAFAMRLLHRVRDPAERVTVLRELGRVSRRWVLFSFYNRHSARGWRDRLRGRYPGETRSAIRRDADEAGLRVAHFLPVGPLARQTLVLCAVTPEDVPL